jgi:archaetidylinositol phosphate synthase
MKSTTEATAMATGMTEFCEQVNPKVLFEMKTSRQFQMQRVQESWFAGPEKRALLWLAEHTPPWIGPDHLTVLGFAAQVAAGVCYALEPWSKYALLGVILCLALNWLGDSLDGTLARVRQRQRPLYGFYVDHMVDTFGGLALMGGLALSGCMHPWVAIGLLVAFLMLSIQSYLATYTLGEFRLSFWRFGPTELRILLAAGNLGFLWKPSVNFLGHRYLLFDFGGVIGLFGMSLMLVCFTLQNSVRLYRMERLPRLPS